MKQEPAFIRGTHHYSFRSGEWAKIVGVVVVSNGGTPRPAFAVEYIDGVQDFIVVSDDRNYEISARRVSE